MVKIEKMSEDCVAALANGKTVFLHQLITVEQAQGLVVSKGELTYSLDESEIITIKAPVAQPVIAPAVKTAAAKPATKTATK